MKCPKCHFENPPDSIFCAKCATRLDSTPQISVTKTLETTTDELRRGEVFAGRYEIIEELGAGGMGRVYRAFDKKIDEEVAIKLIKPEIAAERRVVERFRNELKMARKIRHKNVCGMYDFHEEGGTLYLTMEYVRGEDLKSVIHRMKILSVGTAISIAHQVAEGLGEAHKLGITHRDLKPGNIMIDKEGQAKIMDFGIARVRQEKGITTEGAVIGTPEYMSPEQVEGKPADARSDLYALGVILFEMVTGHAPFEGETPLAVAHKHKYEPAPDPKKLNPQIPAGLSRMILHLLEKEREKRCQTTDEVLSDLETVEETLPIAERIVSKRKPTISRKITVEFTPKKLLIPAGVLIAAAAIVFGLLKFLPRKEAPPAPSGPPAVAILYFKNNTGDKNLDIWREGLWTSLINKLSQSRYIRVLPESQIYGILKRLNLLEQESYTPEDLKEIALRGQATHIIQGKLSKAGERFRINLTLQNASTQEVIAPEIADGTGEASLLDMVDDLAERLKANLGLAPVQIASDINRKLGDVYTNSVEAYKFYVQGYQVMLTTPFDPSIISYFNKAVAVDPQFAMAYFMLAYNYNGTGHKEACIANIQKAFELKERVSERERYLIEGGYYQYTSERTWDKAIIAFSKLITLYPWDNTGNKLLADFYWLNEEWDKSIERYEVLRRLRAEDVTIYVGLAWNYLAKGQLDKAREVLEGYLNTIADNRHIRANLGMVYCIQEDFEKAKNEIEKAYSQPQEMPDKWYKLLYLLSIRDFVGVETLAKQWEAEMEAFPNAPQNIGARSISFVLQGKIKDAKTNFGREMEKWRGRSDLYMMLGAENDFASFLEKSADFPTALSASERFLRFAREKGYTGFNFEFAALYRRGIIQARQGKFEDALRSAEELRQAVESGPVKKRIRYYEGLLAFIDLLNKNTSRAQDHLQKALSGISIEGPNPSVDVRPEFLDFQAEAFEQAGRLEEAQRAYEEILSSKSLFWSAGSTIIFARTYYKLAKVLERMGDKPGAAAKYQKFLDLWKNADLGLPEVEDAQKRLAGLKR